MLFERKKTKVINIGGVKIVNSAFYRPEKLTLRFGHIYPSALAREPHTAIAQYRKLLIVYFVEPVTHYVLLVKQYTLFRVQAALFSVPILRRSP